MTHIQLNIQVLPNKSLTEELMNEAKTRYRADKIIRSTRQKTDNITIIGLTHKDISVPYKGKKDWGGDGIR